jgi:transcriptional regulator with XRE-family HTH domain
VGELGAQLRVSPGVRRPEDQRQLLVLNSSVSPEYSLLERKLLSVVWSLPSSPDRSCAWNIEGKLDHVVWLVLLWNNTPAVNRSVLNIGVGVIVSDAERRQESKKEKMRETVKRRAQLADFLKTRRARLRPEQFDLPTYPRRRKPGLRREELAQLVGVGVSWYTWLEQGRDIHVSDQILSRLADILQLSEQERSHLFLLARGPLPDEQGSESHSRWMGHLPGTARRSTCECDRME